MRPRFRDGRNFSAAGHEPTEADRGRFEPCLRAWSAGEPGPLRGPGTNARTAWG